MKEVGRPKHGLKARKRSLGGRLFEIQQSAEKVRRCGITGNIAIHVPPVSLISQKLLKNTDESPNNA